MSDTTKLYGNIYLEPTDIGSIDDQNDIIRAACEDNESCTLDMDEDESREARDDQWQFVLTVDYRGLTNEECYDKASSMAREWNNK